MTVIFRCIGIDFSPIKADVSERNESESLCFENYLDKEFFKKISSLFSESIYASKVGFIIPSEIHKGYIWAEFFCYFARWKGLVHVGIKQDFQDHNGIICWPSFHISSCSIWWEKSTMIQRIYDFWEDDWLMILSEKLFKVWWEKKVLVLVICLEHLFWVTV